MNAKEFLKIIKDFRLDKLPEETLEKIQVGVDVRKDRSYLDVVNPCEITGAKIIADGSRNPIIYFSVNDYCDTRRY